MSDTTTIACWPACVDAIEWSYDGIIALASEEQVELLFPQTKSNDTEHDFSSWHHIPLAVSWFNGAELPEKEAGPVSSYSIGEEISTSAPVSIAWSPPGIAKHRRCALGVLTSSLVLSIWASEGKVDEGPSWKRKLIVNDALVEYFSANVEELESSLVKESVEKMRLRGRIRCFAWAPPLPSMLPGAIVGTQTTWGQPIVAVANEDNQVAFVAIDTPATTLRAEKEWSGEVLNHFQITPDSENVFEKPTTFDEIMQQQRYISRLAWSPWTVRGDWHHSVLVYATNDDVRARVVTYSGETIGIANDEVVYPDIKLRYAGPMKWSPQVQNGDAVTLALFTLTNVVVLKISARDATIISRTERDLDGRWDEMSVAAWDHTAEDPNIHFGSLQATLNHTARLRVSGNDLVPLPNHPHWREQLWDAQTLFSAKHELQGRARCKVWGLTTSPLGDFIAVCNTLHPTHMIEYGPPNDRRTSMYLSSLQKHDQPTKLKLPTQNFTAEGLTFTLRKHAEQTQTSDATEASPTTINEITTQLCALHATVESNPVSQPEPQTSDLRAIIAHIKHGFSLSPAAVKHRMHTLVSQTLAPSSPTLLPRTLTAYRLATFIASLPNTLSAPPFSFSAEITEHARRVVALIDAVMDSADGDKHTNNTNTNTDGGGDGDADKEGFLISKEAPCDTCDFCAAEIPLEDLDTATCRSGHEFSRCGLSFLAIQHPGISKACGLCGVPVLSEEFVWLQEGGRGGEIENENGEGDEDGNGDGDGEGEGGESEEPGGKGDEGEGPVSLARALFLACDVCVYCAGKFTG